MLQYTPYPCFFELNNGLKQMLNLTATRYTPKTIYLYYSNKDKPDPYPKNVLLKLERAYKKYSKKAAPSISVLKHELGLDDPVPIKYSINGQPCGIIVDTKTKKRILLNADGLAVCYTGPENQLFLYRGQNTICDNKYQDGIKPCIPSVFRCKSKEECLLQLKRTIQFERRIDELDEVKEWKKKSIQGYKYYINKPAISQHYGFVTNLLDVTSDFDVAAFFATIEFKNNEMHACRDGVGVIYIMYSVSFLLSNPKELNKVEIVGEQPIPRPDEQSAYTIKMKQNEDLNKYDFVYRLLFKHRGVNSRKYLNQFNNGIDLFPNNEISKKVQAIKKDILEQKEFTDNISNEAIKRYSEFFNNVCK